MLFHSFVSRWPFTIYAIVGMIFLIAAKWLSPDYDTPLGLFLVLGEAIWGFFLLASRRSVADSFGQGISPVTVSWENDNGTRDMRSSGYPLASPASKNAFQESITMGLIFSRRLNFRFDGQVQTGELCIHEPQEMQPGRWACSFTISFLVLEPRKVFGSDAVEAVQACFYLVKHFLSESANDNIEVWWKQEGDAGGLGAWQQNNSVGK